MGETPNLVSNSFAIEIFKLCFSVLFLQKLPEIAINSTKVKNFADAPSPWCSSDQFYDSHLMQTPAVANEKKAHKKSLGNPGGISTIRRATNFAGGAVQKITSLYRFSPYRASEERMGMAVST